MTHHPLRGVYEALTKLSTFTIQSHLPEGTEIRFLQWDEFNLKLEKDIVRNRRRQFEVTMWRKNMRRLS